MHLVIISGAARPRARSNTAKIIAAFQKGYEEGGNTTEVWYLSDQSQWAGATQALERSDNILIALPLYVESVPASCWSSSPACGQRRCPAPDWPFCFRGAFRRPVKAGAVRPIWRRCLPYWAVNTPGRSSRATCLASA